MDELKKVLLQTFKYAFKHHSLKPTDFVACHRCLASLLPRLQVKKRAPKMASLTPAPGNLSPARGRTGAGRQCI